jgi:hypothetical protein
MAKKFFLGGADGEMRRIREVLEHSVISFVDAGLGWGAKASAYGTQIVEAATAGDTPVLIELELDCTVPMDTVVVDHHGPRASEPASLLQVLSLLGIEPTRLDTLIAANDSGWFVGMQAVGATAEEMLKIRAMDRAAQGITAEQEAEAERALNGINLIGDVRVIWMAHSKCAPVGDRLAIVALTEGKPIPQYLVLSDDGEVNFSGDGALCVALKEKFQGWNGGTGLGKAGETAFWGGYPDHTAVVEFVREAVGAK